MSEIKKGVSLVSNLIETYAWKVEFGSYLRYKESFSIDSLVLPMSEAQALRPLNHLRYWMGHLHQTEHRELIACDFNSDFNDTAFHSKEFF
jgi:hypothetical protein